tara:strand:+ start:220 stop:939 length:720 start_codon:yes stop_codon:yes gene_type:complete
VNIQDTLLAKYNKEELGHFYILSPNRNTSDEDFLTNWSNQLISKILDINEIINHEDFLEVKPTKANGKYGLDDLSALFSFLNYKATRAKRKIILIHNADKFSTYVSNKLLKTLEEPPVKTTIFLLNPTGATLLQTITSRGIKLRVPIESKQNLDNEVELLKRLKELSTHSIIDKLKNNISEHKLTLSALSSWCTTDNSDFATYGQLESIIKEYEKDELFHNAPTHRLFALATLIKELPL